ncbi:hypothetical protein [Usitatibacter palustris]|uniref:Cysteine-rich secretory protein family protein n=1 Tax=Usitatibacter palustris TaxID=2732487 RepID=A0A6M4HBD0_9PROT|nr:hypothetical protein [Usitatibacter palustris]QJR16532.1 hypothetical protein DSM104440_03367 [Usitatibacter palustris]
MKKFTRAARICAGLILAGHAVVAAHAQAVVEKPIGSEAESRLGPAPWFDPAFTVAPSRNKFIVVPTPVGPLNTFNYAEVVAAYNAFYNVATPSIGFTGSVATCDPGSMSLAFQQWTLTRINFLRAMAGVNGNTVLDTALNTQEQAAALIVSATGVITSAPQTTSTCWTQAGADGSATSSLALADDAIPLYMTDPGTGNEAVGHRRWILHSRKSRFGLGNAIGPANATALYVFDFQAEADAPNGIPWPPRGYVPLALFPAPFGTERQRWSFGFPNANFGSANVAVTRNGTSVPVSVISRTTNGYGDNTIVWAMPTGHVVTKGSNYAVTISGISGAPFASYSYNVMPIDPADPPPAAPAGPPRLVNASTRGQVLTGADVMIAGFIVGGPTPKTIVVTVAGPSLTAAGVPGALQNPAVTLVRASDGVVIGNNDNWQSAPNAAAIQAAGFAPAHPFEPAVMMTLPPGAYTAVVQGAPGMTGVGLVALYEVDTPDVPLINLSTRGQVLTGDSVMIAGFVVGGSGSQNVVVTVAGPSLTGQGVPGALANPRLTIVRASDGATIATNDNWQTQTNATHVAAIQDAGFAPAHANEPAVYLSLPPGAYTAVVQGVNNTTGVALVGVYRAP